MRVLVVEDNDFTRMTLSGALVNAGVEVVGETGSAAEAIRIARRRAPDAAMLDLDLGAGPSGIDLAAELRSALPGIGLVILSSYEDPRLTGRNVSHMPADALYAVKGQTGDAKRLAELLQSSVALARGETTPVASKAAEPGRVALTDAQIDVMRLVADGMSNAQIAAARFVSESSVERIMGRIAAELQIPADAGNRRVLIAREYLRMTGGVPSRDE